MRGASPDLRIVQWVKPHLFSLAVGLLCVVAVVAIELSIPFIFGRYLVDDILFAQSDEGLLRQLVIGGAALFLLKGLVTYGQVYLMSAVGQRVVFTLRSRLYRHLLDLPLGRHQQEKSGKMVARMTSDVGMIQNAITAGLPEVVQHSLMLLGTVGMIFLLNWKLTLISLIMLPIAVAAVKGYGDRIRHSTTRLQEGIADLTATMQESLEGIRVVKAFRMEKERADRFEEGNRSSLRASLKAVQAMATVAPVMELILVVGMMIVVWYGGRSVLDGRMTPGSLFSFLAYLGMASRPVGMLTKSISLLQQAKAASARIAQVLETPVEDQEPVGARSLTRVAGRVTFDRVSFAYDSGPAVLQDITLEALPGETIALVGRSGAGKSTLVNLIPRFYRPSSGRIMIDGVDIATLDLSFLRQCIGLVPQETLLFGMTVAENIRAGRSWIDRRAIEEAAVLANAHDFIMALPEGYETVIGERGATLSGGQRQRIAIARAVAGNPKILILDEATSALDSESENQVRDALLQVQRDRTTFVIAHRLSTVMGAEKIVVLSRGRIVEVGRHDELLQKGDVYPRLYRTQFAEPEGVPTVGDAARLDPLAHPHTGPIASAER